MEMPGEPHREAEFTKRLRALADGATAAALAGPAAPALFGVLIELLDASAADPALQDRLATALVGALQQPACVNVWRTRYVQHLGASAVLLEQLRAHKTALVVSVSSAC